VIEAPDKEELLEIQDHHQDGEAVWTRSWAPGATAPSDWRNLA